MAPSSASTGHAAASIHPRASPLAPRPALTPPRPCSAAPPPGGGASGGAHRHGALRVHQRQDWPAQHGGAGAAGVSVGQPGSRAAWWQSGAAWPPGAPQPGHARGAPFSYQLHPAPAALRLTKQPATTPLQGDVKGEGGLDDATGTNKFGGGASMKQTSSAVDLTKIKEKDDEEKVGGCGHGGLCGGRHCGGQRLWRWRAVLFCKDERGCGARVPPACRAPPPPNHPRRRACGASRASTSSCRSGRAARRSRSEWWRRPGRPRHPERTSLGPQPSAMPARRRPVPPASPVGCRVDLLANACTIYCRCSFVLCRTPPLSSLSFSPHKRM